MTDKNFKPINHSLRSDGFSRVAFWQLMAFLILILLIWVNETLNLTGLWFGVKIGKAEFYKACSLTIGVIIVAIITVGHTYVQQKRIIKGLLVVCSGCRKIRVDQNAWDHMDQYVAEHSLALISHGLCPVCYEKQIKEVEEFHKRPSRQVR